MNAPAIRGFLWDDSVMATPGPIVKMGNRAGSGTLVLYVTPGGDLLTPVIEQAPSPSGPFVPVPSSTMPATIPVSPAGWFTIAFTFSQPFIRLSLAGFVPDVDFPYGILVEPTAALTPGK
jgi:hypothetical protein